MDDFKDIPGYENYSIDDFGNILSKKRSKLISQHKTKSGYLVCSLVNENGLKQMKVHQWMAITFLNHKPNGNQGLTVDHIDNFKLNNHISNLQLVSQRINGSKDRWRNNPKSKYVGVNPSGDKWIAKIDIDKKIVYLGTFNHEFEAFMAYEKAKRELAN